MLAAERQPGRPRYPDPRYADGGLRNDDPYVTISLEMRRSVWLAVMDRLPPEHQAAVRDAAGRAVAELEAEKARLDAEEAGLLIRESELIEQLIDTEADIEAEATRITSEAFVLAGREKEIPE